MKPTSINVRVDEDLKNRVTRLAKAQGVSISELVRDWFIECVELEEKALAPYLENLDEENS